MQNITFRKEYLIIKIKCWNQKKKTVQTFDNINIEKHKYYMMWEYLTILDPKIMQIKLQNS